MDADIDFERELDFLVEEVTQVEEFPCDKCTKVCKSQRGLTRHKNSQHAVNNKLKQKAFVHFQTIFPSCDYGLTLPLIATKRFLLKQRNLAADPVRNSEKKLDPIETRSQYFFSLR